VTVARPARTAIWVLIIEALSAACHSQDENSADLALEVLGLEGEATRITWGQLRGMTAVEGFGGMLNTVGRITPPARYTGIPLEELLSSVGTLDDATGVQVVASDGYTVTLSGSQVIAGSVVTFNPETGDPVRVVPPPTAVLAYERESRPITADEGPLRVAYLTERAEQVTEGHLWIKMVTLLRLVPQRPEWALRLVGARTEEIDRSFFESGSAPGCHGATWTDGDGRIWTGIPLWLLVGWVDDQNVHARGAFDRDLAARDYPVDLISGSGDSVTLSSTRIAGDDGVLLAHEVDGSPLDLPDAPLRLVGPSVGPEERLGGVVEIRLDLP
jgi:DMSO/TMAO reductase YedYZ molybdopterin-dependent catalytic subunit